MNDVLPSMNLFSSSSRDSGEIGSSSRLSLSDNGEIGVCGSSLSERGEIGVAGSSFKDSGDTGVSGSSSSDIGEMGDEGPASIKSLSVVGIAIFVRGPLRAKSGVPGP